MLNAYGLMHTHPSLLCALRYVTENTLVGSLVLAGL